MIYLDYNATSPLHSVAVKAMADLQGAPLNPSSVHGAGRQAKKLLENARADIAAALSAFQNEVLFTASATEANNMVLRAFAADRALLVSAIEHPSVGKAGAQLGADILPVDGQGVVRLDLLESKLKALGDRKALVSVMLANNETGVIQPLADIAAITRQYGALLHADAVQALGKLPLDWGLLGVDMLTISGHKAGGPVGGAALLIRNDLPIKPLLVGGSQELGRRAGTVNVPAIVGFAAVVKEVARAPQAAQWAAWRDWLQAELKGGVVFSAEAPRLPNTLCLAMPGVRSDTQLMHFDLEGFAVSAGSACSSGRIEASPVLLAMGVAPELAQNALRVSFGWQTGKAELEAFAAAWNAAYDKLRKPKVA